MVASSLERDDDLSERDRVREPHRQYEQPALGELLEEGARTSRALAVTTIRS